MTLTLNQVDVHEDEEEVDHQDTDIKPAFGRDFYLVTSDFSLIDFSLINFSLITSFNQDGGAPALRMSKPVF